MNDTLFRSSVRADAASFCDGKKMPFINRDVVVIPVTERERRRLVSLNPLETRDDFISRTPSQWTITDETGIPRYSVGIETGTGEERGVVAITPATMRKLRRLIYSDVEYSGRVGSRGIQSLDRGTVNWSPVQRDRDVDGIPFHTHPLINYGIRDTNAGWPSRSDVANIPESYRASHLIPCVEGVYVLSKTTCNPLKKTRHFTETEITKSVRDCSWLLFSWDTRGTIYLY